MILGAAPGPTEPGLPVAAPTLLLRLTPRGRSTAGRPRRPNPSPGGAGGRRVPPAAR